MKKIKYIIGVVLATMLIACGSDYEHYVLEFPETPIIPEIVAETIPLSDALDEMFSVFDLLPVQEGRLRSTRSAMEEQMNVTTIYAHQVGVSTRFTTRSTSQEDEDMPLLYVVNFEEGGFSILAASTHIPAPIIAISNESNFSPSNFAPDHFLNSTTPFVPCSELGSSFRLFSAVDNDYYVASGDEIGNFIAGMIVQFAVCYRYRQGIDRYCLGDPGTLPTTTTTRVGPLLPPNIAKWHQGPPFNAATPIRGIFNRGHAPAGCVPLALAQIMAFNEFPRNRSWNGHSASWHDIQQFNFGASNAANTPTGRTVAAMLAYIGAGVNARYAREWTFATPVRARDFLRQMGYQNVNRHIGWREDRVLDMLRGRRPVFQAAVSGLVNGHAWVIDGYWIRWSGSNREVLLHCVWGWSGNANGWYASGIFSVRDGAVIPTNPPGTSPTIPNPPNYRWGFRAVTYNLP